MTVHFAGKFKGNGMQVNLCRQWALSPTLGATTEDKAQVTCKGCAKKLGVTPAVDATVSANPTGTCQCCFGDFKVRKGSVALHGYKRPGVGFIIGRCRGEGELPFEVSCERTKFFRAELEQLASSRSQYLANLHGGLVTELPYSYTNYGAPRDRHGNRPTITTTVKVGDEYLVVTGTSIPSWKDRLKSEVRNTERVIEAINADIKFLDGKISTWAPANLR